MNPTKWTRKYHLTHWDFLLSEHLMFNWPTIWRMRLHESALLKRIESNK